MERQKKAKYTKKIPKYDLPYKNPKPFKASLNYEKTPINEYLNYDLSEEINLGLKEVKLLSDEIKYIKEEKKKESKQGQDQKEKVHKRVRIRRTNFNSKNKMAHSASACNFR